MSKCDMCGHEEQLKDAIVEGATLRLCKRCAAFGNVVSLDANKKKVEPMPNRKGFVRNIYLKESTEFVVAGAGQIIKQAREERDLTQSDLASMVGEKESVIQKVETSLLTPSLRSAKKFEKILDIKIIDEYDEEETAVPINLNDKNLTIGDLLKHKKK